MIRVGVIGIGGIGMQHVKRLKAGIRNAQMTAICDIVPAKMKGIDGVKTFTNSRKLIRSGLVDAVIVATPHYGHTTIGIDAMNQGLHLLTEKPISVHRADCERLIAAHAANPKLVFAAMFQERTQPAFRKMKQMITDGVIGEIKRVNWIMTDWYRSECYYASGEWRATWKGEGGGVLLNQCPHTLDKLWWLCGSPCLIRANCHNGKYHNIEVEDEVSAYLEYPNGATGQFVTSTGESPGTNRLEIAGDKGLLVCEGNRRLKLTLNEMPTSVWTKTTTERFKKPKAETQEIPIDTDAGGHTEIVQNFIDAIADGVPLIAPAEEGINSVELANAMIYSSFTRKDVTLPIDGKAYERMLKKLIRESKIQKQVVQVDLSKEDFSASLR